MSFNIVNTFWPIIKVLTTSWWDFFRSQGSDLMPLCRWPHPLTPQTFRGRGWWGPGKFSGGWERERPPARWETVWVAQIQLLSTDVRLSDTLSPLKTVRNNLMRSSNNHNSFASSTYCELTYTQCPTGINSQIAHCHPGFTTVTLWAQVQHSLPHLPSLSQAPPAALPATWVTFQPPEYLP